MMLCGNLTCLATSVRRHLAVWRHLLHTACASNQGICYILSVHKPCQKRLIPSLLRAAGPCVGMTRLQRYVPEFHCLPALRCLS